ncbi:unnamed protein product [Cylicocyclus nassatus]|uniref:BED-type domain-containing protein n=1 Tax=Cylicocyclus nassatus TaxID=53992 RepID=A0AA36GGC4_CYLNA|nr:unnamed protein product [Cylicocyclus nassatus]
MKFVVGPHGERRQLDPHSNHIGPVQPGSPKAGRVIEHKVVRRKGIEKSKLKGITKHERTVSEMSVVWDMFTRIWDEEGNGVAECKVCKKTMKIPHSKTTTNLLLHLSENHKVELEKAREEKKSKIPAKPVKQPSIRTAFLPKMSNETRRVVNTHLAMLIADKSLSLSLPTSRTFRKFVQSLNSSYTPPSRSTLVNIMHEKVNEIDQENKDLLSNAEAVAITADCWSSFNCNAGLLTITGHVAGPGHTSRANVILDCVSLGFESHTADVISGHIRASLQRLSVDGEKICALVADGASNMKKAAAELNVKYLQCGAHLINLAVRKALNCEHVAPLINKCKSIVTKLNRSSVLKGLFRSYLDEFNLPKITPSSDCPTRWGSTYAMICDVISTRAALDKLMENQSDPFDDEDIKSLKSVKVFLEPYYELTKKMCAADATSSLLLAGGKLLLAKTESTCNEPRTKVKQFGNILLMETRRQFAPSFADETLRISTLLDPRFAFLERIASSEEWKTIVERLIELRLGHSNSQESQAETVVCTAKEGTTSFWDPIADSENEPVTKRCLLSDKGEEMMIEIQQYSILLKKNRPEKNLSPLVWWKSHSQEFPLLSKEVAQFLVIPATSVDCERFFSLAGIVYGNKRRGRLSGEHARLLLMCKCYANKEVGRECKFWNASEVRRYARTVEEDDDDTSSSDSANDDATTTSDQDLELDDLEEVEEVL